MVGELRNLKKPPDPLLRQTPSREPKREEPKTGEPKIAVEFALQTAFRNNSFAFVEGDEEVAGKS